MDVDRYLQISDVPELRQPLLLVAFAGWNDAAQSATFAVETLRRLWSPQVFATIDPEEFYDFTEVRPMIGLTSDGKRSLTWPENNFYAHRLEQAERDIILFLGAEPQLRWRTYCRLFTELGEQLQASALV